MINNAGIMPLAKWPAHCSLCDTGIKRGDCINKYGNKWVHSECNRIRSGCGYDTSIVSTRSSMASSASMTVSPSISPDVSPGCTVSSPGYQWLAAKSIYPQAYCTLRLVKKEDGWHFERMQPQLREPTPVSRQGWMSISDRLVGYSVSECKSAEKVSAFLCCL